MDNINRSKNQLEGLKKVLSEILPVVGKTDKEIRYLIFSLEKLAGAGAGIETRMNVVGKLITQESQLLRVKTELLKIDQKRADISGIRPEQSSISHGIRQPTTESQKLASIHIDSDKEKKTTDNLAKSVRNLGTQFDITFKNHKNLKDSLRQSVFKEVASDISAIGVATNQTVTSTVKYENELLKVRATLKEIGSSKSTKVFGGDFSASGQKMRNVGGSFTETGFTEKYTSMLSDAFSGKELETAISSVTKGLETGFPTDKIESVSGVTLKLNDDIVKLSATLRTATGYEQKFTQELNKNGKTAKQTSLEVARVADVNDKLFLSAKRHGFDPSHLTTFKQVGEAGVRRATFNRPDAEGSQGGSLDLFLDKSGDLIPNINRQFQTFTSGIARNTRELVKWSVSMALVYGPIAKAQEMIKLMIQNEAALAKATRAVNVETATSSQVFSDVYKSAKLAGEGMEGTLAAFTQAFRAAGGSEDQADRYTKSFELLNDSLVLSKLSTLNEAQAIDVLSASLMQMNQDLSEGTTLLDMFVNVSNKANTDISTLATGFSIMASSADSMKMSSEELAGSLAAISALEGIMDPSGAGNIMKRFASGYLSSGAVDMYAQLGISVKTGTGELKGFMEISREIRDMYEAGLIDDAASERLTMAFGNRGSRTKSQALKWLRGSGEGGAGVTLADQAADVATMTQGGEAAQALEHQLDTVETASTRLSNSFQLIAQSLGNEGGMLDEMAWLLDKTSSAVEVINSLVVSLGKAGPAIVTLSAAMLLMRKKNSGFANFLMPQGNLISKGGSWAGGILGSGVGGVTDFSSKYMFGNQQKGASGLNTAGRFATGGVNALAGGFTAVAGNLLEGDTSGAVGSAIGAGFGAALTGTPLGAAVGAAIGDGFANTISNKDFSSIDWSVLPDLTGEAPSVPGDITENKDILDSFVAAVIGTEEALRESKVGYDKLSDSKKEELIYKFMGEEGSTRRETMTARGNLVVEVGRAFAGAINKEGLVDEQGKMLDAEEYGNRMLAGVSRGMVEDFQKQLYEETGNLEFQQEGSGANVRQLAEKERSSATAERALKGYKGEISELSLQGDIEPTEAKKLTDGLVNSMNTAALYAAYFADDIERGNEYIKDTEDIYDQIFRALGEGTSAQKEQLSQIISDIDIAEQKLEEWQPGDKVLTLTILGEDLTVSGIEDVAIIKQKEREALAIGAGNIGRMAAPSYGRGTDILSTINEYEDPLTSGAFTQIKQRMEELQKSNLQDSGLDRAASAREISSYTGARAFVGAQDGGINTREIENFSSEFWDIAKKEYYTENPLEAGSGSNVQWMTDYSKEDVMSVLGSSEYADAMTNLGSFADEEDFGAVFKGFVTDTLHADNRVLQMLMERLVDLNQDQLDGMYNIPDGATFWVPLTAASYGRGGGSTGFSGSDGTVTQELDYYEPLSTPTYGRKDTDTNLAEKLGIVDSPQKTTQKQVDLYTPTRETQGTPLRLPTDINPKPYGDTTMDMLLSSLKMFNIGEVKGMSKDFSTDVDVKPVAQLELSISSTTQLLVDGRIMANVVKQYLESDMLRAEESSGAVVRNVVI